MEPLVLEEELGGAGMQVTQEGTPELHPQSFHHLPSLASPERAQMLSPAHALLQRPRSLCSLSTGAADGSRKAR